MTTLYLIRHAEAEGNLYRRIHGQYNSLITDNGYRQIQALQKRFADVPIDAVYSSDLFRTMTTARAIYVPKGLPLQTRADLRELGMGEWEDRSWAGIDRTDHTMMGLFSAASPDFRAPGGESFPEVRRRGVAAILDIASKHPNQSVAVFAHGTFIRNTVAEFLGIGPEGMKKMGHSDNTAVTLLEITDGKVKVVYMDDNSHLTPEISTLAQQHWWKKGDQRADVNLWFAPFDLTQEADRVFYQTGRRPGRTSTAAWTATTAPGFWTMPMPVGKKTPAACPWPWRATAGRACSSWTPTGAPRRKRGMSPSSI